MRCECPSVAVGLVMLVVSVGILNMNSEAKMDWSRRQPWRLLVVRTNAERRVVARLTELGIIGYVPMERLYVGFGARRREHERPLVRGYVFARLDPHVFPVSFAVPDVRAVHAAPARAQKTVDKFLADVAQAEAEGLYDSTRRRQPELTVGSRVTVSGGKFSGLAGVIVGMKGQRRCELVTSLFGQAGRMTIELDKLELAA